LSSRSKYFWTCSLGSCLMASSFTRMSSASTFPYFYIMSVRSAAQLAGAGCNCRTHSFARPLRFNLAILNNLSGVRSRTSAAIVSRSAQSVTSSQSCPQNRSSSPCGLVNLLKISLLIQNSQKSNVIPTVECSLLAFINRSQRQS
jgi:hypothetical protein